jgi:2-dehydro-3-deoxyphosphogluconate aldolase/(4S)-4-hydroxy-2-oxoglutarate aldolase
MTRAPVIPVLTVASAHDAVPLARALVAGGVPVLEVTLRTPAALAVIAAIAAEVPEAVIGAGTVLNPRDLAAARQAGARFAVSPGLTSELARAAEGFPLLPGAVTPSEIMAARDLGFNRLKFFPAGSFGGIPALASLAGPFQDVRFCPTGGVTQANLRDYLALPNVVCAGGTWLAREADIAAGNWDAITANAARAVALGRPGA